MVDHVDYHLLPEYPDRDEPENADFTSFTGKITEGAGYRMPHRVGLRGSVEEQEGRALAPDPEAKSAECRQAPWFR